MTTRKKQRRARRPQAKPGEQLVWWGTPDRHWKEESLVYSYGEGARSPTSRLLCEFIEGISYCGKTLSEHLLERGYDLTTFRLSVRMKDAPSTLEASNDVQPD